jgi:hypothetical protein
VEQVSATARELAHSNNKPQEIIRRDFVGFMFDFQGSILLALHLAAKGP